MSNPTISINSRKYLPNNILKGIIIRVGIFTLIDHRTRIFPYKASSPSLVSVAVIKWSEIVLSQLSGHQIQIRTPLMQECLPLLQRGTKEARLRGEPVCQLPRNHPPSRPRGRSGRGSGGGMISRHYILTITAWVLASSNVSMRLL